MDDVQRLCDKLKKKYLKIDKENNELRKKEISLKSDIEELTISFDNEVSKLLCSVNYISSSSFLEHNNY